jgi:hypothetical protein
VCAATTAETLSEFLHQRKPSIGAGENKRQALNDLPRALCAPRGEEFDFDFDFDFDLVLTNRSVGQVVLPAY